MKSIHAKALTIGYGIVCLGALLSCNGTEPITGGGPGGGVVVTPSFPITGAAVQGLTSFDQSVHVLMDKYKIPGGAVAIVRDGKLIYARGFGYADVENKVPVQPDALFRIASVS